MSHFSGVIDEIKGIAVDSFLPENFSSCTAFFLSHCHTDHMRGLNDLLFSAHISSKSDHFIYCSEGSALILKNLMKNNESVLAKIRTLTLGPNFLQVPILDSDYHINLVVTLIPAGHCLGSCMLFFETKEKTVLYTGDFRFNPSDYSKISVLHTTKEEPRELDAVYLDTTFWTQANLHFPSRHESLNLIVTEIDKFRSRTAEHGHVHIDKPARIGSEFFIMELAKKYKKKVHVNEDCFNIYFGIQELMSCITKDTEDTFLHMCQAYRPGKGRRRLPCVGDHVQVLHIRPSAQWYSVGGEYFPVKEDKRINLIQISHSMHSSRAELIEFIKYFKPKKVVPCVVPVNATMEEVQGEINDILNERFNSLRAKRQKLGTHSEDSHGKRLEVRPPLTSRSPESDNEES